MRANSHAHTKYIYTHTHVSLRVAAAFRQDTRSRVSRSSAINHDRGPREAPPAHADAYIRQRAVACSVYIYIGRHYNIRTHTHAHAHMTVNNIIYIFTEWGVLTIYIIYVQSKSYTLRDAPPPRPVQFLI